MRASMTRATCTTPTERAVPGQWRAGQRACCLVCQAVFLPWREHHARDRNRGLLAAACLCMHHAQNEQSTDEEEGRTWMAGSLIGYMSRMLAPMGLEAKVR